MAKTTPTNQQAETTPGRQSLPSKKKYILQNNAGKIVATLIDRELAEKWVADHKNGAVKIVENELIPVV